MIKELSHLLGADRVLTCLDDMAPYVIDHRKRYQGTALCVVLPSCVKDVAITMTWASQHQIPVIPQGGNTGLVGGSTPDKSGKAIILSLKRLKTLRQLDKMNDTVTIESGATLLELQVMAEQAQRLFPLSLAAEGCATIGGILATNAGGTQVLRYGNARELCLGLEVVLPDGRIWNGLKELRKNNTGYDLKQLFIGSEGTLGIITAATFKLFPRPLSYSTAFVALKNLQASEKLFNQAREIASDKLSAFELMSLECLKKLHQVEPQITMPLPLESPWFVLIELSETLDYRQSSQCLENILSDLIERGHVVDAAIAQSIKDKEHFWRIRESIPEAHRSVGGNVKNDISLPLSSLVPFLEKTTRQLTNTFDWLEPSIFGHFGDGNLHYNMGAKKGFSNQLPFVHEMEIRRIVHDSVMAFHGSISAEHGIGQLKREELALYKNPIELKLMQAIKENLDPQRLMNPGKVLPDPF